MEAFLCLENQQLLRPGDYKAIDEKQEQIHAKHNKTQAAWKKRVYPPALLGMQILRLKLLSPTDGKRQRKEVALLQRQPKPLCLWSFPFVPLETLFLTGTRAVATALFSVALLIS